MPLTIEQTSIVPAAPEEVWERVTSPEGINHELAPFVRMTVPGPMKRRTVAELKPGDRLGRSWLLFLGFLPFDFDDIRIAELEHGRRFREASTMLSIERWEHERVLRPTSSGTEVADRVTFQLKKPLAYLPFVERALAGALSKLFAHRHRRLAKWFARPRQPGH